MATENNKAFKPQWMWITSDRSGCCEECKELFGIGAEIAWNPFRQKARCGQCGEPLHPVAGRSAQRTWDTWSVKCPRKTCLQRGTDPCVSRNGTERLSWHASRLRAVTRQALRENPSTGTFEAAPATDKQIKYMADLAARTQTSAPDAPTRAEASAWIAKTVSALPQKKARVTGKGYKSPARLQREADVRRASRLTGPVKVRFECPHCAGPHPASSCDRVNAPS